MQFLKPGVRNWVFNLNSVWSFEPKAVCVYKQLAASLYIVQNQGDGIYQGIKGIVNDLKIDTKKDFFS